MRQLHPRSSLCTSTRTCWCREPHPTGSCHEPVLVNEAAELVGPSQPRRIGMPNQ
jgi:hypothetical protein